jgi:hypothetical protein
VIRARIAIPSDHAHNASEVEPMTDEDLFKTNTVHLGGPLPRDRFPQEKWDSSYGHILKLANSLIRSAREHLPRLPNIHFDFILNGSFNAYAFKADGRYFIGFNTGTQYLLQLVFHRMLSDPQLFENVGNPSEERGDLLPLTGYAAHAEHMYQAGIYPDLPQNNLRYSYSCNLIRHAIYFLVGHEIAHITRGHVDYMLSKSGIGFFPELGWKEAESDEKMEGQCLETDADRRSTISAVFSLYERSKLKATRGSVEEELFDWAFAMNVVFRLFGDIQFNRDTAGSSRYPPLPIRRLIATIVAHRCVIEDWDPNLGEAALKAFKRAALYCEIAFSQILGTERGGLGLEAFGKEGVEYVKQLAEFWEGTVSRRIAPFAFEPNPTGTASFVDQPAAPSLTAKLLANEP